MAILLDGEKQVDRIKDVEVEEENEEGGNTAILADRQACELAF